MKANLKNIILSLTMFFMYGNTHAAGQQTFTPTFVGCFPSGTCFIGVAPDADTACSNKGQIRFDITLPGSTAQYSTALATYMAGKHIAIFVTDTCLDGYATPSYLHTID